MRGALAMLVLATAGCSSPRDLGAPIFAPAPSSPVRVGTGSGQIALVDLDGDGHLDLVSRHLLDRYVRVLRGDGRGRFTEAEGGDVDEDGRVDVTASNFEGDGMVLLLGRR